MGCLLLVSSESDSAALAPLQQEFRRVTRTVVHNPAMVADWLRLGTLRERPPGVWQVGVSIGMTRRRTAGSSRSTRFSLG